MVETEAKSIPPTHTHTNTNTHIDTHTHRRGRDRMVVGYLWNNLHQVPT
jgi:hypothetical protein